MDRPGTSSNRNTLTQSFSGALEGMRNNTVKDRLTESCHGQISTDRVSDDCDLTNLNWLSCLTPQSLGGQMLDVDNVAAEELLGSSMNSTTTDHSDGSQNYSTENSCNFPVSPLGQNYHKFLEERKRSEGDNRRYQQSNPVVMNRSTMMYDANPQQYTKPPLSFGALICLAIESSQMRRLPVKDIYMWIEGNFPYYKNASGMSWKNSVRHNLSLSKAFVKMPRPQPGNSKTSDCSCHKNAAAATNKSGSPQGEICHCCKADEEGGKGCLWGINDDYRNSLIASFRRSGLTYPLILPLNRVAAEENTGGERILPEFYSQAALQRQQQPQPQPVNSITHPVNVIQQQVVAHCPDKQRNQPHLPVYQPRQRQGQRSRQAPSSDEGDDRQAFMRDLRFFNQAIKRTQALMFKEQIDEGEEEEHETEEQRDEVMEDIPLDSHGLTDEQIVELNHLARRGRRRKTPVFRHITPQPSAEHDYCKNLLGHNDLYESETDNDADTTKDERPTNPVKRQRISLNLLQAAKRKYQDRTSRKPPTPHKQPTWLGHRRSSYHGHGRPSSYLGAGRNHSVTRGPGAIPGHEATPRGPSNAPILPRRRRPGRPPKNRPPVGADEPKRTAGSQMAGRKRKRESEIVGRRDTDSGSLADDEDFDDAATEPMEDASYGEAVLSEDEEEVQVDPQRNAAEIQAAEILLQMHNNRTLQTMYLKQKGLYFEQQVGVVSIKNEASSATENGVPQNSTQGGGYWCEEGIDDEQTTRESAARSPENVPPPTSGIVNATVPKRRGRRPRKDTSERERFSPLTPSKPIHDRNEGHVSSRSGLPKRKAAVNAPAVWNQKNKRVTD